MPERDAAMAMHREDETVLRSGQPQHYRLERRTDGTGQHAWDMVTRLPLLDRGNATVGVIAIFRDVTEQVRAKAKIDDEVRRRDQFLAMLSHELRNPLGAVVSATAMLKGSDGDATARARTIDVLERQSRQMARLLDELLDASRVTQNKIELRRRVIDLRSIATEAADAVRRQAQERGLELTLDLDEQPMWVNGDATRLQQIQINLLSNAIKYTPRGGRVHLSVARDGDFAVVRVRDNGAGIPSHMLDSIFDLFVQARHTLDHADGGLGVGLTLVRALVEMHGGSVTAQSEGDGKGTELIVRLPLTSPPSDADTMETSRASAIPAGTTVVVVEDNADSLEMLCSMLKLAGASCHSAGDGRSALALIDQVSPDVVILDVGLPHLDGLEVARRIRSNPRHAGIRLIALTGYGLASDRKATAAAGFDYHLVKPVQPEDLFRAIADDMTPRSEYPSELRASSGLPPESRPR
jgi:two-component system CheB/CheR fusion protein